MDVSACENDRVKLEESIKEEENKVEKNFECFFLLQSKNDLRKLIFLYLLVYFVSNYISMCLISLPHLQ
jgi:hypothetical protein